MKRSYDFYKWRIWIILSLTFVMSLFHRSALGVVSDDIARTLNLSAIQLGNLASITFYSYAIMQIPAGILLDVYGYKKVSMFGVVFTGMGSILLGLSDKIWMAYGGRLLVGIGTSVIFISVLKAQSIWFSKEQFSKASSKLSFIGNLGGVVATFPLAAMAIMLGWRNSFYIMGLACFFVGFMVYKYVYSSPKDVGYNALGDENQIKKIKLGYALKRVIRNRATWRNFFILFSLVGCTTALTGLWGVSYFTSIYGVNKTTSAFYISFIIYGLVGGSILVGNVEKFLSDPIKTFPRISLIINTSIWIYILIIEGGKPPIKIVPYLFFIMGVFAMSLILCFTDIKEKVDSLYIGIATSIVNSGEFVGSSIISILIGYFLDFNWSGEVSNGIKVYGLVEYKIAFLIFLVISILGIIMTFIKDKEVGIEENIENCKTASYDSI
ncbi:MFS transporter [Clostridium sp. 'White wine YQ']|uniref:MFS transporter n=1 Tax=Clostridium sp. 'White wine YQ' TaxID=3027474 RepID=UPI002366A7D8|nr:MFS transporter [Clostridium sp. 'White wine YQ']MDD7795451.1 MFS transporter [Clostridium sp. 'White wine YQ']